MRVFNYIFNRWDTHSGNQIISESKGKYNLALIDNAAITFISRKPKFRVKSVNAATLHALQKINDTREMEKIWSEYLPSRDYRAGTVIKRTLQRIQLLLDKAKSNKNMVIK